MSEHSTNLCAICHENINLDDLSEKIIICIPAEGGCGNFFHKNCVNRWCNTSHTKECPICRNPGICEKLRTEKAIKEKHDKEPLRQREVHAMADAAARWRAYRRIIDTKLYIQIPEEISEEEQDIFSEWYTNFTPNISDMINAARAAARDETDENMKNAYLRVIQHKEPGARANMPTIEFEKAHNFWWDAHSRWQTANEDAKNEKEQISGTSEQIEKRAITRSTATRATTTTAATRTTATRSTLMSLTATRAKRVEYAEDAEATVAKLKVRIEFYTDKAEIARHDVRQLEWRKKLSQTSSSELEELLQTYIKQVDDLLKRLETLEDEFYEAREVRDVMVADVAKDDFVMLEERYTTIVLARSMRQVNSDHLTVGEVQNWRSDDDELMRRRQPSSRDVVSAMQRVENQDTPDSESGTSESGTSESGTSESGTSESGTSESEEQQRQQILTIILRNFGEDWESEPAFPLLSRENLERMPLHILREIRDLYQRLIERGQNMMLSEIPVTAEQREELEQRNEVESVPERFAGLHREVNTEVEQIINNVLSAQDWSNDMNTPASVERRLAEIRLLLSEDESSVSSDNQSGGMENLKPFNKEKLEKLDRYMPGAWDFVQMEKDRTDEMPLERSHQKFVCPDIYDKIDFLEGWMRKVINKFQPNNPNIHLEIRGFFPNLPPKIFNHDTLSSTMHIILGNPSLSEDAKANIKLFLKNIAMGVVRLAGGIFQQGPQPQTVLEEMAVGPNPLGGNLLSSLLSYRANDIFENWDVEVQGHELQGYNINISEKRTGENPVGGLQGPIFFRINGLNMEHIEEDLPEILEGINVLKQQVARTCNVRSNRITRAGGKRKLLRYKYKKHLGGSDNFEEISDDIFSDTQSDFYSDPLDNSSHSIRRATRDLRNQVQQMEKSFSSLKLKSTSRLSRELMDCLYHYESMYFTESQRLDSTTNIESEESEDEELVNIAELRMQRLGISKDSLYNEIKYLLNKGANPNYIDESDTTPTTPLIVAAKNNWYNIVNLLLESGANIEKEIYEKGNALIQAVREGHHEIVLLLIKKGANVNHAQNVSDMTALHWAVLISRENIVKLLLKNGANPDLRAKPWESSIGGELAKVVARRAAMPRGLPWNTSEGYTPFELAIFILDQGSSDIRAMWGSEAHYSEEHPVVKTVKIFQDYYAQKAVDKGMVAEVGAMHKVKLPANISGEYGTNIENTDFKDGEIQKFLGGMKPEDLTPEKLEELLSTYRVNNKIYEYLDIFDKKHPRFDCKSDESKLDELEKWMIHTLLTLQLTFEDASFYIGGRVIPNTPLRRDIYFSDEENVNETKLKTEEEIKNFIRDFKKQPSIEIQKLLNMFVSTTPRVHNHTGTVRYFFMDLVVVYNYYLFERIDWNSNPIRPYNRENSNDYRFGIGGLWSLRNGALNQRVEDEINAHKELKLNVEAFKKKLIRISCYRAEEKSRKRRFKKQEDIRMDDDSDDSAESLNSLFDKKLKLSGV